MRLTKSKHPSLLRNFLVGAACALLIGSNAQALTINLTYIGGGSPDAQAQQGFQDAALLWQSVFSDPVSVNVDWDFASNLGTNVLASAWSTAEEYSYTGTRNALNADRSTVFDDTAVANLQAGPSLSFVSNGPDGLGNLDSGVRIDNGGTQAYNSNLRINTANAKALGLAVTDPAAADATIKFSSLTTWDFDGSDGIAGNALDFVGVAAHEIGHALGFTSGVDDVDYYSLPEGPGSAVSYLALENSTLGTVLDLFRYPADSVDRDLLDWAVGLDPDGLYPFFSIDGGATSLAEFSTGEFNGAIEGYYDHDDNPNTPEVPLRRQASHWRDHLGLGLLDPTAARGEFLTISANDLIALDAVGWDLRLAQAPAPLTALLLLSGLLAWRRRACYRPGLPD